jgi:UDP-glucose 4-epimerase
VATLVDPEPADVKVLIAGGAGYIGSTLASACLDAGDTPVIVDNLITGRREFTHDRVFYEGDIADADLIDRVFDEHDDIEAAILCAALISVPDSVANPIRYYEANVTTSLAFVSHLIRNGCTRMIFSSSASIYGPTATFEVTETSAIDPRSPYARTKAICEEMFEDITAIEPLRIVSLRYFNPIGADPQLRTGLQSKDPSHALGRMIVAHRNHVPFEITGTDYPTRDGTGIRDYIHVWDLADAHLATIKKFDDILGPKQTYDVINLGTGRGTTVRELVAAFNTVVATPLVTIDAARRPGDTAGACANGNKAYQLLNWKPRLPISKGIEDSFRWVDRFF